IARAIANQPKIVIADEPTGNLDPDTSWEIMRVFEEINDRGTTVIMATHSKEIVNTMKKRVIAIEDGIIVRDEHGGEYGYEMRTFKRHIREGIKNIFRNGWMSVASISAVTVTLTLVGVFVALMLNLNHMAEQVEKDEIGHTSELQSRFDIVCRLVLDKKNSK